MTDLDSPRQNHLLDALPAAVYERLFPLLELVQMPLGEVLYESGDKLRYVYFPTTCIVSILYVILNGASAEIAVVGNEGIIGVALFMGGATMPNRAVVLSAGCAYRLRGHLLCRNSTALGDVATGSYTICYCAIPIRLLPRWRKRQSAIGIIRWISNSATGCLCASTGSLRTS